MAKERILVVDDERKSAGLHRPVRLALSDLLRRLIWSGAFVFGVSLVLAALLAYSISRAIERIAKAAEDVAGGSFEQLHGSLPYFIMACR